MFNFLLVCPNLFKDFYFHKIFENSEKFKKFQEKISNKYGQDRFDFKSEGGAVFNMNNDVKETPNMSIYEEVVVKIPQKFTKILEDFSREFSHIFYKFHKKPIPINQEIATIQTDYPETDRSLIGTDFSMVHEMEDRKIDFENVKFFPNFEIFSKEFLEDFFLLILKYQDKLSRLGSTKLFRCKA